MLIDILRIGKPVDRDIGIAQLIQSVVQFEIHVGGATLELHGYLLEQVGHLKNVLGTFRADGHRRRIFRLADCPVDIRQITEAVSQIARRVKIVPRQSFALLRIDLLLDVDELVIDSYCLIVLWDAAVELGLLPQKGKRLGQRASIRKVDVAGNVEFFKL